MVGFSTKKFPRYSFTVAQSASFTKATSRMK
jgi:hypothetical protein